MKASFESTCPECGKKIEIGDDIANAGDGWIHARHVTRRKSRRLGCLLVLLAIAAIIYLATK